MFTTIEASFVRAMCSAIFKWEGLGTPATRVFRIHGRRDLFVDVRREVPATPEPVLVILDAKMDGRLGADARAQIGIGKEPAQLGLVIPLDDEVLVELRLSCPPI